MRDSLIAIGDAQNDLCMFDVADVSIARWVKRD
ncbi:HAD hydrolase family protein [Dubosiella newyorkensis]